MNCRKIRLAERKKKNQKERNLRKGKLVETAAAEEIGKVAFGNILLDDFLHCLENPAGFPHSYHKPGGGFNH
jgi:hypothetical protein